MALSRCIETRLLEAVWTETKNCFAQASLGLASTYQNVDGSWRIYARPFNIENDLIAERMIFINPSPPRWEPGVGGVGETIYAVEVTFVFPFSELTLTAGANSYVDHIAALRAWLTAGGSMPNNHMDIEDPATEGAVLGWMHSFAWGEPERAPGNVGLGVPVLIEYQTREDKAGVRR